MPCVASYKWDLTVKIILHILKCCDYNIHCLLDMQPLDGLYSKHCQLLPCKLLYCHSTMSCCKMHYFMWRVRHIKQPFHLQSIVCHDKQTKSIIKYYWHACTSAYILCYRWQSILSGRNLLCWMPQIYTQFQ